MKLHHQDVFNQLSTVAQGDSQWSDDVSSMIHLREEQDSATILDSVLALV